MGLTCPSFACVGNLTIAGRAFTPKEQMIAASTVTGIVVFFLSNLGSLLVMALVISFLGIAVHGATRTPDDLFLPDDAAPGQQQDGGILGFMQAATAVGTNSSSTGDSHQGSSQV